MVLVILILLVIYEDLRTISMDTLFFYSKISLNFILKAKKTKEELLRVIEIS